MSSPCSESGLLDPADASIRSIQPVTSDDSSDETVRDSSDVIEQAISSRYLRSPFSENMLSVRSIMIAFLQ